MSENVDFVSKQVRKRLRAYISVDCRSDVQLNAPCFDKAYILPVVERNEPVFHRLGGVVDSKKNFILSSSWDSREDGRYDFDDTGCKTIEKAIFIGNMTYTWGHMLTDSMKKVWFLYTDEAKKLIEEGYKVVYVGFANEEPPVYVRELFYLAGVDFDSFFQVTEVTCCEMLVIPDNSIFAIKAGRFFTKEYCQVIQKIRDSVPKLEVEGGGKLYFARKGCHNSKNDYGEESLIDFFRERGFKIITPEHYSVSEQVGMLKGCECFAATEGSISHNAIFCKPETECLILRKYNSSSSYSRLVNQVSGVNGVFIDVHHSSHLHCIGRPWDGPFYLCVTKHLMRYFHLKGRCRCRWFDKEWYRYVRENPFALFRGVIYKSCRFIEIRIPCRFI